MALDNTRGSTVSINSRRPSRSGIGRMRTVSQEELAIVGIAVVGLALRLFRLDQHSIWLDEYLLAMHFNAPDSQTYLRLLSLFSPEAMPLGFLPLYWWGSLFDLSSTFLFRLQPVALSTLCIPVLWLIGREVHSNRAGLIAAALLAISPMHIWAGQSVRPVIFTEFYALVSVYALLKALGGNQARWWLLHVLANLLLIWTHVFMVFLIAAEGACLLVLLYHRKRALFLWCLSMAICGLSALVWLGDTLASVPSKEDDFILTIPSIPNLIADWIADDAGHYSDPFIVQGSTWAFLPDTLSRAFADIHVYFDIALAVFFAACVVWAAWSILRHWRGNGIDHDRRRLDLFPGLALMLAVGLLPLIIMLAASLVWRPCILPRYTSYSSMMLYVVAGAALTRIAIPQWRNSIIALLALTYAYQLSFVLPGGTRTDWIGVDHYIASQARPQDIVLLKGTFMAWDNFTFNARETTIPVVSTHTLQAMCEKADRFLKSAENPEQSTVWAVVEPYIYTLPPLDSFEKSLRSKALEFRRRDFPGMNGLYTYAITSAPGPVPNDTHPEIRGLTDCVRLLEDLGLSEATPEQRDTALRILRRVVDTEWPRTRFYFSLLAFNLCDEACPELAVAAAHKAVALDPAYSLAHFALAVALGESGDAQGAVNAVNKAVRMDRYGYFSLYVPLITALYNRGDMQAAVREFEHLRKLGVFLPQVLRARTGLLPATLSNRLRLFPGDCL